MRITDVRAKEMRRAGNILDCHAILALVDDREFMILNMHKALSALKGTKAKGAVEAREILIRTLSPNT